MERLQEKGLIYKKLISVIENVTNFKILWIKFMKQNFIYAELKEWLNSGNVWYDSFQTLYISSSDMEKIKD
jgi:acid stress-induced BolA-like protein IbaG/YrbA